MEEVKVKGYSNLVRDPITNAIINTNATAYEEYISRRQSKEKENQKVQNLESEIASMKNDLDEIKSLLRSLANESR
jgi:uncharacterized coiled-coil DUF342 family protein